MSDSLAALRRKITGAGDLHAVVRTMKALAASSIGDYERSVRALADYDRMVCIGLGECFRQARADPHAVPERVATSASTPIGAIVFGSDQGLVGPFNDVIAAHAISALAALPGRAQVWAVGERVQSYLKGAGLEVLRTYAVPDSVEAIAPLVAQIQIDSEAQRARTGMTVVHVFHNRPLAASLYEPVDQRLLPLDATWQQSLAEVPWPGAMKPEVMDHDATTLRALIREYLFISLFRACAESLASENASRLAAMNASALSNASKRAIVVLNAGSTSLQFAADGRVIVAHLGGGASLCALRDGRSVETAMVFRACRACRWPCARVRAVARGVVRRVGLAGREARRARERDGWAAHFHRRERRVGLGHPD